MSGIITAGINRSSGLMKAPASGGNTPSFMAVRGLDGCSGDACRQAFNDATLDKLEFNQEVFDTDGCYDTSNYRFTPNKAGFYYIEAMFKLRTHTDRFITSDSHLRFNGGSSATDILAGHRHHGSQSGGYTYDAECNVHLSAIKEFNGTSDYVEVWCNMNITVYSPIFAGGNTTNTWRQSMFHGFRLG
tara:strand:- start:218 stop:781 length:564 start_codon:yes stop_codon:yes gene_type:complete